MLFCTSEASTQALRNVHRESIQNSSKKKNTFVAEQNFSFGLGELHNVTERKKELRFVANGEAVGVINSPQTRGDISLMSLDFS